MPISKTVPSTVWQVLGTAALVLGFAAAANAQAYSFNQFLSGGGGGQDPQKKRIATAAGAFVCLGISPGAKGNTVSFMISSRIPQPRSRIVDIAFDMGRHANLFRGIAVAFASPGAKGNVVPPQAHPFLRGLTPEFWINVPQRGHLKPEGLTPGRMIAISATLADGKTIADVVNALHEGLNPSTAANGLRVGVIVLYLLGGPPPGVGTINDDGGFVTTVPSANCR